MEKNKIRIIVSSFLVISTLASASAFFNFKLKRDKVEVTLPDDSIETITNFNNESKPITIEIESNNVVKPATSLKNNIEQENNNDSFINQEVKEQINDLCKKNGYSSDVNKYMNKMMNYILENYDSNYDCYKSLGFPDKQEFCSNFLEQIENNKPNIVIFESGDENFKSYQDELDYYGGAGLFVPGENNVIVSTYGDDFETCKVLFEELTHSNQNYSYANEIDDNIYYSLVEGEPAFLKCLFMDNIDTENYSYVIYDNKGGDYIINGAEGTSDLINSKYYLGLLSLTDYDTMQEVKNGNGIMPVLSKIKEDYGVNTDKIYKCLCDGEDSTKEDIENFEKVYCDCMKVKLNDISSKEELNDLFNSYRFYRVQFGITCYDDNGNNIIDGKITSYNSLDKMFIEKIKDYDLFNCDNNELVFKALMCKFDDSRNSNIERSINNLYFEDNGDNIFIYSKNCDKVTMCNKDSGAIINMDKSTMKTLNYSEKVVSRSMSKTY